MSCQLYLQVTKTIVYNLNNEVSHILSPLYIVVDIWLKLRDIELHALCKPCGVF